MQASTAVDANHLATGIRIDIHAVGPILQRDHIVGTQNPRFVRTGLSTHLGQQCSRSLLPYRRLGLSRIAAPMPCMRDCLGRLGRRSRCGTASCQQSCQSEKTHCCKFPGHTPSSTNEHVQTMCDRIQAHWLQAQAHVPQKSAPENEYIRSRKSSQNVYSHRLLINRHDA